MPLPRLACVVLALSLLCNGCGAIINGTKTDVKVRSATPGSEIFINGGLAGQQTAAFTTSTQTPQIVTVRAPGHDDKTITLERRVKVLPVVLDVLWCLTIVGVAAPISDAILGTFSNLEPRDLEVSLDAAQGDPDARGSARFTHDYAPGAAAPRAADYAR